MDGVCQNSIDAVSDRDFAIEFTSAASLAMLHVSRLSEEIVIWMSQSFGFIELADRFCTGSSIMPQKKNPDVAELARGKTSRVVGHLMGLFMLMKGQPLAYNKDNQEDKEPLFDSVDTLKDTLRVFAEMVPGITVKAEAMERAARLGYATATDLADALVKKGVPFRDAHEAVARAVKHAMSEGVDLSELPLGRAAGISSGDRRRRAVGAHAARLARLAQRRRRHGARAGARADRASQGAPRDAGRLRREPPPPHTGQNTDWTQTSSASRAAGVPATAVDAISARRSRSRRRWRARADAPPTAPPAWRIRATPAGDNGTITLINDADHPRTADPRWGRPRG